MSTFDPNKQLDKLLIEQSSALLETSQRDENGRDKLADWLLQSKRHVRTHLFMAALEEELKNFDPQRRMPIPDVKVSSASVADLRPMAVASTRAASPRRTRAWSVAAMLAIATVAIAIAAAAVLTLKFDGTGGWQTYTTAVGEQRAVQLPDGSVVQLNTGSSVKVLFSATTRDLRLIDGEALFKVHQDPTRPFNVYTSDATIVAVGTQFNVYRLGGGTKVSVLEGRVRVSAGDEPPPATETPTLAAPLLAAGEEAQIRRDGRIDRRRAPDIVNSAAWVQRRVVFKQEPLGNVVTEFNRYRSTPQFRVEDPALAARKYSGTFDVDDPKSLEDVLENERDVAIETMDGEIVIRFQDRAPSH